MKRQATAARRGSSRAAGLREKPIGVFDSGIGGLTVVKSIAALLPHESIVYLGDTARTPYGTKSADVVRRYSLENTDLLLEHDVKAVVVACNSSSAAAMDDLERDCPVPVIGVIVPGAEAAVQATRSGKIGVIATEGTIASGSYTRALRACRPDVQVYTRACPLFVPLVEEGWVDDEIARAVARRYLSTLRRSRIDTLILGCTHYPLLAPVIAEIMGEEVMLIDSGAATAERLRRELVRTRRLRQRGEGGACFFVTDAPERFVKVGARFLGSAVDSAVRVER